MMAQSEVRQYAARSAPQLSNECLDEVVEIADKLSSSGLSIYDAVDCLVELVEQPSLIAQLANVAEGGR